MEGEKVKDRGKRWKTGGEREFDGKDQGCPSTLNIGGIFRYLNRYIFWPEITKIPKYSGYIYHPTWGWGYLLDKTSLLVVAMSSYNLSNHVVVIRTLVVHLSYRHYPQSITERPATFGILTTGAFTYYYVSNEGGRFANADATVIFTVCPSVKLLTEGEREGGLKSAKSCWRNMWTLPKE